MEEPCRQIAVMGAGAVGSYFGGMLARAGADVTLIARGEHLAALTRDGLFHRQQAFSGAHAGSCFRRPGCGA